MNVTSGIRAAFIRWDPKGQLTISCVYTDAHNLAGNIMRRGTTQQTPQDTGKPQAQPVMNPEMWVQLSVDQH